MCPLPWCSENSLSPNHHIMSPKGLWSKAPDHMSQLPMWYQFLWSGFSWEPRSPALPCGRQAVTKWLTAAGDPSQVAVPKGKEHWQDSKCPRHRAALSSKGGWFEEAKIFLSCFVFKNVGAISETLVIQAESTFLMFSSIVSLSSICSHSAALNQFINVNAHWGASIAEASWRTFMPWRENGAMEGRLSQNSGLGLGGHTWTGVQVGHFLF